MYAAAFSRLDNKPQGLDGSYRRMTLFSRLAVLSEKKNDIGCSGPGGRILLFAGRTFSSETTNNIGCSAACGRTILFAG